MANSYFRGIEFYEEKDERGKPRLRFCETELEVRPPAFMVDEIYARADHCREMELSDGTKVPVSVRIFTLWPNDAAELRVPLGHYWTIKT